jgi:hypothetical protein
MRMTIALILIATAVNSFTVGPAAADITDFTAWSLVQDPPDSNFTASITPTQAALQAGAGAVPPGTDIGLATINGNTPAESTAGFVFDPGASFTVAIDYDLSFVSASGALGLGFGVGEDVEGMNSAGIAFVTLNGSPFLTFAGAARINDVNQPIQDTGFAASLIGSLFVEYDAINGNLILGASHTPGDNTPAATTTFSGLQNQWNGGPLIASFFIRSTSIPVLAPNGWQGGDATAIFTNFRVLDGSAQTISLTVAPDTLTVFRGLQIGGMLEDVFQSDDSRVRFNPGFTLNSSEAPVWLIFDGTLPNDSPGSLEIVLESQAGTPGLTHTLEAWNWTSLAYDVVNIADASFNSDTVVTVDLSSGISDYARPSSGSVRTRVGWRKTGFTINYPWEVRVDQIVWRVQ